MGPHDSDFPFLSRAQHAKAQWVCTQGGPAGLVSRCSSFTSQCTLTWQVRSKAAGPSSALLGCCRVTPWVPVAYALGNINRHLLPQCLFTVCFIRFSQRKDQSPYLGAREEE